MIVFVSMGIPVIAVAMALAMIGHQGRQTWAYFAWAIDFSSGPL
jgi:hypothetical protein